MFLLSCGDTNSISSITIATKDINFSYGETTDYLKIDVVEGEITSSITCIATTVNNNNVVNISDIKGGLSDLESEYDVGDFPVVGVDVENTSAFIILPENNATTTTGTITLKAKSGYRFEDSISSFVIDIELKAPDGSTFIPN